MSENCPLKKVSSKLLTRRHKESVMFCSGSLSTSFSVFIISLTCICKNIIV